MKRILLTFTINFIIFSFTGVAQSEQRYANGTAADQGGNTFEWINYGTQDWAIENAEVVTYRDGTEIPQVTDATEWSNLTTGAWCYYDNDPAKEKLYNWYAVMGIHDTDPNTPNKEFAPEGWYVPSDAEWTTLENYLIADGYNYDGTTTENKIAKSIASTTGWNSSTDPGAIGNDQSLNNSSGFNASPVSYRIENGGFYTQGFHAMFWSSTEDLNFNWPMARNRYLSYNSQNSFRDASLSTDKNSGLSVRLVRDASSVGAYGILLNGTVSAENNQIKNVADPTEAQDAATKSYVEIKTSEISNIQNFSNNSKIGLTGIVYDFEGNKYNTLVMCDGKQWTTQYLNVSFFANGDPIPEVVGNDAWRDLTTPAWCYPFNEDSGIGKLYNGFALTDARGLAPEGWHIATEDDWNNLIECLGGADVAGGKIKLSGTEYWAAPNVGSGPSGKASNSSGMSLTPAASREGANGNFYSQNSVGFWNYSTIVGRRPFVELIGDQAKINQGLTDPYDGSYILLVKD